MSASDMIRRFREQPATSKVDRQQERMSGSRPNEMWWNSDGGEGMASEAPAQRGRVSPDDMEHSNGAEPRIGSTLVRPEPQQMSGSMRRSVSPQSRLARYEGTRKHTFSVELCYGAWG